MRASPSVLIQVSPRHDKVAIPGETSARHGRNQTSADEIQRAVFKVSRSHAAVGETDDGIASTLPRKLGIGKYACG